MLSVCCQRLRVVVMLGVQGYRFRVSLICIWPEIGLALGSCQIPASAVRDRSHSRSYSRYKSQKFRYNATSWDNPVPNAQDSPVSARRLFWAVIMPSDPKTFE